MSVVLHKHVPLHLRVPHAHVLAQGAFDGGGLSAFLGKVRVQGVFVLVDVLALGASECVT